MAIVKFVPANCPMNNIFPYVMREEATEAKLIDGIECSPDTALEEFRYAKQRFHKEGGRQYYHVIQAFAPEDPITPEMAHEIGMELAMYFDGYQAVVATHINEAHIHNHISQLCQLGERQENSSVPGRHAKGKRILQQALP